MPTIVCIVFFLSMYFFLRDYNNSTNQDEIEYIHCNGCGEKVNGSNEFCPYCKETLKEECPHCRKMVHINWRYCPYCGIAKENRWLNE
ncbi:zinc ribbon domain-containing protein [Alkaliphilus sp. MSJ-5]|uniref:Zinc ribbon domain-containing protein n=1 Tax=Alkaliphilus flagellatus TaxID=2841507 RepID=A0ABS6G3B1_9FIRM|nr:zinc ribbon domain-containing protein [Alkaliphilus flagellatus]MBU5676962.1 zinc ribbon domain-containing protein [Alkaliphilus flagellatus]